MPTPKQPPTPYDAGADVWVTRLATAALALVAAGGTTGLTVIAALGKDLPPVLAALVGTAVGLLGRSLPVWPAGGARDRMH